MEWQDFVRQASFANVIKYQRLKLSDWGMKESLDPAGWAVEVATLLTLLVSLI